VDWTKFTTKTENVYDIGDLRGDERMSLEHIDWFLYRVTTIINNATRRSFNGIPSHDNLTIFTGVRLKSIFYAFPR